MQSYDVPELTASLNALAEVYDRKPLPAGAIAVWFKTLQEFPPTEVFQLLSAWPKNHGKFPVPTDIWKALNERSIEDREREHQAQKTQINAEIEAMPRTEHGAKALALIWTILRKPQQLAKTKPERAPGEDDE